jgi:hypothetical protein
LVFGLIETSGPEQSQSGAISVLLVLICVTALVGLVGSAGVSLGIATARFARPNSIAWGIFGGAAGGFFIGAFGKLIGLDAFNLLVGQSPGDITGGSEGLLLGAAVGLAAALAARTGSIGRGIATAAACGGSAGLVIALLGGRLLLGSLDLLQRQLSSSKLRLDQISALFGERAFGPISQATTAALEGALFAASVVGAIELATREKARRYDQG